MHNDHDDKRIDTCMMEEKKQQSHSLLFCASDIGNEESKQSEFYKWLMERENNPMNNFGVSSRKFLYSAEEAKDILVPFAWEATPGTPKLYPLDFDKNGNNNNNNHHHTRAIGTPNTQYTPAVSSLLGRSLISSGLITDHIEATSSSDRGSNSLSSFISSTLKKIVQFPRRMISSLQPELIAPGAVMDLGYGGPDTVMMEENKESSHSLLFCANDIGNEESKQLSEFYKSLMKRENNAMNNVGASSRKFLYSAQEAKDILVPFSWEASPGTPKLQPFDFDYKDDNNNNHHPTTAIGTPTHTALSPLLGRSLIGSGLITDRVEATSSSRASSISSLISLKLKKIVQFPRRMISSLHPQLIAPAVMGLGYGGSDLAEDDVHGGFSDQPSSPILDAITARENSSSLAPSQPNPVFHGQGELIYDGSDDNAQTKISNGPYQSQSMSSPSFACHFKSSNLKRKKTSCLPNICSYKRGSP